MSSPTVKQAPSVFYLVVHRGCKLPRLTVGLRPFGSLFAGPGPVTVVTCDALGSDISREPGHDDAS